jgi:RNA recognition motif-containing protein
LGLIEADNAQLPWSTSNEDLVDLFSTIGPVKRAEIQYEPSGRSRGSGVVEFEDPELAETSICEYSVLNHLFVANSVKPNLLDTNMVVVPLVSPTSDTPTRATETLWMPKRLEA